jgi:hypothetical protein
MTTYQITWRCHVCEHAHSFFHELAEPDAWPNKWSDLKCDGCGSVQDVSSRTAEKRAVEQVPAVAAMPAPAAAPPPAPRPDARRRSSAPMRFPMHFSPLTKMLVWPLGTRRERAGVSLEGDRLHVQMPPFFEASFGLEQVAEARREDHWPWYRGLGWRTDFGGTIALVGAQEGVICLELSPPAPVRLFLRTTCRRLYISLEDPAGFLAMLAHARG